MPRRLVACSVIQCAYLEAVSARIPSLQDLTFVLSSTTIKDMDKKEERPYRKRGKRHQARPR